MGPVFFRDATALRAWFEKNHDRTRELWVGFYKKGVDQAGVSYDDAVEVALCFGWIDGIVKRVDEERYMHRFSPRTPRSPWSKLNVARARRLMREGRMHPAGQAALDRRTAARTGTYSHENRPPELDAPALAVLRADSVAWEFYREQPAGYRRTVAHWVLSAKREETRSRRLRTLLTACHRGKRLDPLSPTSVR